MNDPHSNDIAAIFWRIRDDEADSDPSSDAADAMTHHQPQMNGRLRDQTQKQIQDLHDFDFGAPAELFPSRSKKGGVQWRYKRFDTAAEAVRFAVEDMTEIALLGAYLEVDEARFGVAEIRCLYQSASYPLKRALTHS